LFFIFLTPFLILPRQESFQDQHNYIILAIFRRLFFRLMRVNR